jgi:uncharacterized damage-inducible protein DinB
MNADAFRQFYDYHFAENRKIWDRYVTHLSPEQFTQEAAYSHGSVRNQLVHLMDVDDVWFSELQGVEPLEPVPPADVDDREIIRAHWDSVVVWQVLLHVVNHGADHRAQILRLLNDLGLETAGQDYIFHVYEQLCTR